MARCEVCGNNLKNGRTKYCSDFCYKFGSSKLYQVYKEIEGANVSYCELIRKIRVAYGIKSHEKADKKNFGVLQAG